MHSAVCTVTVCVFVIRHGNRWGICAVLYALLLCASLLLDMSINPLVAVQTSVRVWSTAWEFFQYVWDLRHSVIVQEVLNMLCMFLVV